MSEGLQQAIATFIGTVGTVMLMMGTYYFGPGARKRRGDDDEGDEGE